MRQIRFGVFETNSSSVHTLTVCTEEEYKKYMCGELLAVKYPSYLKGTRYEGMKMMTPDDAYNYEVDYFKKNNWSTEDEEDIWEEVSCDFKKYNTDEDDYMEEYEEHFTTPSGDRMVVFGEYGRDG